MQELNYQMYVGLFLAAIFLRLLVGLAIIGLPAVTSIILAAITTLLFISHRDNSSLTQLSYANVKIIIFAASAAVTFGGIILGAIGFAINMAVVADNKKEVIVARAGVVATTVVVIGAIIPIAKQILHIDGAETKTEYLNLVVIVTLVVTLLGAYIGWLAVKEDKKDKNPWIRSIAIAFASTKGTSFQEANLTDANFTRATLKNTDFRKATLTRTNFDKTKGLELARSGNTYLQNSQVRQLVTREPQNKKFNYLDLEGVNLHEANLEDADFSNANLKEANLHEANLEDADFSNANLKEANLHKAILKNANFSNANFDCSNLQEAKLENANFSNANLKEANLHEANLENANFSNANLKEANLHKAILKNANFSNANFDCSNLQEAKLENASFIDADFYQANLQKANLSETILVRANFERADLRGANLTVSCIQDWIITKSTKLDGVICERVFLKWDSKIENGVDKGYPFDQMPPRGKFKAGGFVTFVRYILETVELYHEKDINPRLALTVLQKMSRDYDEPLDIVALGKKGERVFIQVKVPENIQRKKFKENYYYRYDKSLKLWSGNIHQLPPIVDSFIEKRINEITSEKTDNFVFVDAKFSEGNYTEVYQGEVNMSGERNIHMGDGNYNENIEGDYVQNDKVNTMNNNSG